MTPSDDCRNAYARQSHDEDDSDRVGQEQRGEEVIVHQCAFERRTALMNNSSVASVNAR